MKLYKFRALQNCQDLERIIEFIENGFYCNNFLNFNDMNEGVYINNTLNKDVTLKEKNNYNICSFSGEEALNNELMWGHYANAGKGIVIEISIEGTDEIDKEKKLYFSPENESLHEVHYNDVITGLDTIKEILTHKSSAWKYEDEWRYLSTSTENPVPIEEIGKIEKIHFGTPYEHLENDKEILKKHKNLQKYLRLKEELIRVVKEEHNEIKIEDYDFKKLNTKVNNTLELPL